MSRFATPCLADEELAEYVDGDASTNARVRVELHIDGCESCRRLVSELAREEPVDPALEATQPEARRDGTIPAQIGRYRVLGPLGMGARGVVVSAYDPELDRPVAIKLLRASLLQGDAARDARERLLREARAMARVSHPNVVAVYDVGTLGEHVFIAMELVEGCTLRSALSAQRPPREHVLQLFAQAGEGLSAAHRAGLVHRDFKPDNVLVGRDGRVRVTDFGLASVREEVVRAPSEGDGDGPPLEASLTVSGVALGTPRYMAPEQHLGTTVDARADQFAFCVALYEALAGEHPFPCGTYDELRRAVLAGVAPERAALRGLPRRVRSSLLRGLAARREERHASMGALLTALGTARSSRRITPSLLSGLALAAALALWQARGHRPTPAPRAQVRATLLVPEPAAVSAEAKREGSTASASAPSTAPAAPVPPSNVPPARRRLRRIASSGLPPSPPPAITVPEERAAVPAATEPSSVRFIGPRLKSDEF